ncbi:MAG: hypothetical protein WDO24_22505 [Pseudomonadota bacterium]
MLASGASADPIVRTAILSILEEARLEHGTKLVGTYPDSWHDQLASVISTSAGLVDLIHVSHAGLSSACRRGSLPRSGAIRRRSRTRAARTPRR